MARSCACRSFHQNPSPIGKHELADVAPTKGNGIPTPTPIISHAPTLAPATAFAVTLSLNNELFKQFIKAYLENQVSGQTEVDSEPCKQPFKA